MKRGSASYVVREVRSVTLRNGHHCGAEIPNELPLSLAKNFALFVSTLSNGASRATSDRKPKTNDKIMPGPILCVRCARRERERERERDTETGGSDVTLVALKLAMILALFLAKNLHLSNWRRVLHFSLPKICTLVSPLLNGADFTLSVAKNVAFSSHSSFCLCQMA